MEMRQTIIRFFLLGAALTIGLFSGFVVRGYVSPPMTPEIQHYEVREGGFYLINPLLACESGQEAFENDELRPFRHRVEETVEHILSEGVVGSVSLYFRDLNNGPWFSIGADEDFSPSSMLKVPLMIAVLREAEENRGLLSRKVQYKGGDLTAKQRIKPSQTMQPGHYYTVEELLHRMIVYSDNDATYLLEDVVDPVLYKKTYSELGVVSPLDADRDDFMSVSTYSSFFRILYNASYLSKEMSEKALRYLLDSEYKNGLVAGVPSDVVVAHKFGERRMASNSEVMQLHDCGIVYYPGHAYLLCVMTRGRDFDHLETAIRSVSEVVYKEFSRQHETR